MRSRALQGRPKARVPQPAGAAKRRQPRAWGKLDSSVLKVLVEERERPRPRELRRLLLVPRRRVVVEAVVDVRVRVLLVADMIAVERFLPRGPAGVDALVESCVVDQQRRLDLRRVGGTRLRAVEGNGSAQIGKAHRHLIHDGTAEAEADGADAAVARAA